MKKRIRILAFSLLLLLLPVLTLAGCWNARELRDIPIVAGIGIDESRNNPKDVAVTVQIVKPNAISSSSSSDSGGKGNGPSEARAFWNLHSSGSSVFEALRGLTHEINGKVYLAHNQVIIIHQAEAKKGIQPILDYFIREVETRPITNIFISEGKASDILEVEPEIGVLPSIELMKLINAQRLTSTSCETNLQELINYMLSKPTSAVVPLVTLVKDNNENILHPEGLAVFKNDRMVGKLNAKESRGLLWVKGKVTSGIISLQYAGTTANLEILNETTKVVPQIKDGEVTLTLKIKHDSVLMEQLSKDNLETTKVLEKLQELERQAIKEEIRAAYDKASSLDADIFGFGELIHKKLPKEWKKIKGEWDAIFRKINLVIEIDNKIRDTGIISKPITAEMN